jgi:hypothetical protein
MNAMGAFTFSQAVALLDRLKHEKFKTRSWAAANHWRGGTGCSI